MGVTTPCTSHSVGWLGICKHKKSFCWITRAVCKCTVCTSCMSTSVNFDVTVERRSSRSNSSYSSHSNDVSSLILPSKSETGDAAHTSSTKTSPTNISGSLDVYINTLLIHPVWVPYQCLCAMFSLSQSRPALQEAWWPELQILVHVQ